MFNKYLLAILLINAVSNIAIANQNGATIEYYMIASDSNATVVEINWETGQRTIIDSVHLSNGLYFRGIDWNEYDPLNKRIFFQEAYSSSPMRVHVYEIETKRLFDLAFDNYSGYPVDMVISPNSKYIIFQYFEKSDDSLLFYMAPVTIILDGASLDKINEIPNFEISTRPANTYISEDNTKLIKVTFLPDTINIKGRSVVIYDLPNLNPIDTIIIYKTGWVGEKLIKDYAQNMLLVNAFKYDNDNNIDPGNYLFLINISNGSISSPLINAGDDERSRFILSPDKSEIIILKLESNTIIRYSTTTGEILGEFSFASNPKANTANIRTDGMLYMINKDHSVQVIDYKNNRSDRLFQFETK
jgi:hypothetical protein